MDDVCTSTSLFPGRRDGALSLRDDPRHICLSHSGTLTAPRGAFADLLACCDIATTWQGDLCVSIATRKEA